MDTLTTQKELFIIDGYKIMAYTYDEAYAKYVDLTRKTTNKNW
jgi:hypothetical protein